MGKNYKLHARQYSSKLSFVSRCCPSITPREVISGMAPAYQVQHKVLCFYYSRYTRPSWQHSLIEVALLTFSGSQLPESFSANCSHSEAFIKKVSPLNT